MKYRMMTLAALAGISLCSGAFAADETYESKTKVSQDKDGSYKKESKETMDDAHGSSSATQTDKMNVDSKGNTERTVETQSKDDPKGLFNTNKVKTKDVVKSKDGKTTTEHKKTVNGDTVEHTKTEQ